jgi:hypothetical protein
VTAPGAGPTDFQPSIDRWLAVVEPIARVGGDWERAAIDAARELDDPAAFVAWARDHRRWTFAVAEAADEVCAKPREAATHVAVKILAELLEDRGVTG